MVILRVLCSYGVHIQPIAGHNETPSACAIVNMSTDFHNSFQTSQSQPALARRVARLPPDQWDKYRGKIQDLYSRKDTTLKDVVQIMEREHAFHAKYA